MNIIGFDVKLGRPEQLISVESYQRRAHRRWPKMIRAYVDGGADDQVSLERNRSAFDRWELRVRSLTGEAQHDLSTTVGGVELSLPVMLAPTGFAGLSHWRGDVAAAKAANSRGTRYIASSLSSWSVEEIAEKAGLAPHFQLYPTQGELAASLMRRAWAVGSRSLFVTVDVPVKGNREGERRTGMGIPPTMTPEAAIDMALHPRWVSGLVHGRVGGRNFVDNGSFASAIESIDIQFRDLDQSTLNWDDFAWMRDQWKGALYIKGVLDPEDAVRAVELGADGVVVSNHGGRQLDHASATIDALPAIAAAVGDRAEVLLDGGVRRGTDVIKAVALGARAVLVGRPYLYGLAVAAERGVGAILDIFREEIDRALTLMGVRDISDLNPSWLIDRSAAHTTP